MWRPSAPTSQGLPRVVKMGFGTWDWGFGGFSERGAFCVQEAGIDAAVAEARVVEHAQKERDVRLNPEDRKITKGGDQADDGGVAGLAASDDFRQQRIVVDGYVAAFGHSRIDSHSGNARFPIEQQSSG